MVLGMYSLFFVIIVYDSDIFLDIGCYSIDFLLG
jgi:hypothetical protein